MKAYDKDMTNGYNKFRKSINNNHVFRKAYNTIDQINNYALPTLVGASYVAPTLAPAFAAFGTALKTSHSLAGAFKNTKI